MAAWLGGTQWWVIPMASGIGIPAYLNGYAAIPLVRGLMDIGMLPGAGLAFMIAGGVTSIPAAMAVYVAVNRTVFSGLPAARRRRRDRQRALPIRPMSGSRSLQNRTIAA